MKKISLVVTVLFVALSVHADQAVHVVQRGDTVYSIARRYSVPVDALQRANDISDPSRISVGLRLVIPNTHKVERGETYYGISRRYNITVAALLAANSRSESTLLRVGDVLFIPAVIGTSPVADVAPATGPTTVVRPSGGGISSQVAPTVTLNGAADLWPHPGRLSIMEGKFPGIRIDGRRGDSVVAVAAGQVIYSGPHSSFGRVVFVQSASGFIYVYGGNDDLLVTVGDRVQVGSAIGTVGTSTSGGSHVFFTVWRDNRFVDPGRAPRG